MINSSECNLSQLHKASSAISAATLKGSKFPIFFAAIISRNFSFQTKSVPHHPLFWAYFQALTFFGNL
jgi:hypothetical protein